MGVDRASFSGNLSLSFNGEASTQLPLLGLRAPSVAAALQDLRSVGSVEVSLLSGNGSAPQLVLTLEFTLLSSPSNRGEQPFVEARTDGSAGQEAISVRRVRAASDGLNLTYAEQTLSLSTAACGSFALGFRSEYTTPIVVPPSAMDLRAALVALPLIGDSKEGGSNLYCPVLSPYDPILRKITHAPHGFRSSTPAVVPFPSIIPSVAPLPALPFPSITPSAVPPPVLLTPSPSRLRRCRGARNEHFHRV